MKRLRAYAVASILLAAAILFGLYACGSSDGGDNAQDTSLLVIKGVVQ